MQYYFKAFRNYAKTKGRATRKEIWLFDLFHYIVVFALSILDRVLGFGFYSTYISISYGYMTLIYILASICPSICLKIRRLHDVGKSGAWLFLDLIIIIPIIGLFISLFINLYLLYLLYLKSSDPEINEYGYLENYVQNNSNEVNFCYKCGADISIDVTFCHCCGEKITREKTLPSIDTRNITCKNCSHVLPNNSEFCQYCGNKIEKNIVTNEKVLSNPNTTKFTVCIFDTATQNLRKEMRNIDTNKFPPSKFATNNTYYAVETYKEGKKVRVYHTKEGWNSQIESGLSKNLKEV